MPFKKRVSAPALSSSTPSSSVVTVISPAMLIRRPQPLFWKQSNPIIPDASPSPLSPKQWLSKDSGAVGLGIVAALDKSVVTNSLAKTIFTTAPLPITSPRPSRYIEESRRREPNQDRDFFRGSPPASCDTEYLSDCCMCKKRLHGKDIYMYMEKAFCSMECRYQQILTDEEQKKRKKMSKISCSPCSGGGGLFFTGVVVA